jgi:hypothetical protein
MEGGGLRTKDQEPRTADLELLTSHGGNMTETYNTRTANRRAKYETPQAIRLTDADRAYGACDQGSTPSPNTNGYRAHDYTGVCVTGKSATGGCYAGAD